MGNGGTTAAAFVGVIGASEVDAATAQVARQVGQLLAQAGAVLVCGGLGGVMEAAAEGARSRDGTTLGILPGTDRGAANRFISIPIVTGLGEARNVVVVRTSQAVIAIGGLYGTLSEIAFCLKLGVPVVGLGTWRPAHDGFDLPDLVHRAGTPRDAVQKALELCPGGGSRI